MNHRTVFKYIHDNAYWGNRESISGPGSNIVQTENIRRELPLLIKRHNFKSIFDAPCGDLYWMSSILPSLGCRYIGGDIVPDIVESARKRNTEPTAEFMLFDIINDRFPDVDLWLCRDVLFHLSFSNIRRTMKNFEKSDIPYILVTSHTGHDVRNIPISTGDFRQLNLFKPPFTLRQDQVIDRFDDFAAPSPGREMLLLKRADFVSALPT